MSLLVEDLEDQTRYRQLLAISYHDLVPFIIDHIKKKSAMTIFYWSACILFLIIAICIRINIGHYPLSAIFFQSTLGLLIYPLICIPVHESLHIIPYYLSGARNIRIGMDLKQYLFYVTAHRYVASPNQFRMVAIFPFLVISTLLGILIIILPGLWKWGLSLFLFVHATMCAGDFALLNFYFLNREKKIYTWDDADQKMAYYYEKL